MSEAENRLRKHEGKVQQYHMLWADIQRLKHEGYSLEEIAYLTDKPINVVRTMLAAPKPKRK